MKLFFDCEFTGLHQHTSLISLGIVAENGHHFYAEHFGFDRSQVDEWIEKNVISNLDYNDGRPGPILIGSNVDMCADLGRIRQCLELWLKHLELPSDEMFEIWGDCLAYDWVLFCELFGGGVECLPRNVYYIPFDICTLFKIKGIDPDINRETFAELEPSSKHNALHDALVTKACYERATS